MNDKAPNPFLLARQGGKTELQTEWQKQLYDWLASGQVIDLPGGETRQSMAELVDLAQLEARLLMGIDVGSMDRDVLTITGRQPSRPAFHELYGKSVRFVVLDEWGEDPMDHSTLRDQQAELPAWKNKIPDPNPFNRPLSAPSERTRAKLRAKRKKR